MKKQFSLLVLCVFSFLCSFETKGDEMTSTRKNSKVMEHLEFDDFCRLIEDSNLLYVYKNDSKTKELFNSFKKIENEQQLIQDVFKGYATNYQDYPHKARIPDSNRILISLPQNADRLFSSINSSNSNITGKTSDLSLINEYLFHTCSVTDSHNQLEHRISLLQERNAGSALARTIVITDNSSSVMVPPTTWNCNDAVLVPFVETPFDFSSNFYSTGIGMNASYCNVVMFLLSKRPDSKLFDQSLLHPVFNRIVKLFHGHETAKDIRKVDWLDLKPERMKNDEGKFGTTFKMICKFREQNKEMRDRHWILAVCEKVELSVEKAEFKALSREFRNKLYSVDSAVIHFFEDAREIPDTVFLTLPEGEKTAELTFYFISEDGTQYSSQSIILTVPEDEKESTSTK